jgi:hypothetical protein
MNDTRSHVEWTETPNKKKYQKMREVILRIVEEFMTQKARGKDISLIPFFVDSYSAV